MNKNRIERPTRRGELAQHSEAARSTRAGKCGDRAGKQRVLTWGDPNGATWRGVSRGHSTDIDPGAERGPFKQRIPDDTRSGRAEPDRNVPTAGWTPQPITPEGEDAVSAAPMGSMGTFRSKP